MSGSPPPAPSDRGPDRLDVAPGPAVRSLRTLFETASRARAEPAFRPHLVETGTVVSVERGTAHVRGLSGTGYEEVLRLGGGATAVALDLGADEIGTVLLDAPGTVEAGTEAHRTERVFSVPAGEALLGRIVSPTGRPLDGRGPVPTVSRLPAERGAPPLLDRSPVQRPLQTGFKVVDALIPVGRGQRELILGDRQTGKTTLATETIVNQLDKDTVCVYCAIGQRDAAVNRVVERLRATGALGHTMIVVASGYDGPGLQYVAPFAATSMAEYFVERGRDALIVYDDLSRHARAYRELSLLLRRPPGREAFPGDIFYLHARLLERAAQLSEEAGGGSLTALPVVETEAENLTAYIPTNLISITDGQIYLSPRLFQRGILPAVDVSRSVSRVGAQAQLPAYRWLAGQLRLAYAQFLELEVFSRFATQLDDETRQALERGRRVREVLKQSEDRHMRPAAQIAVLLAVTGGALDDVALDDLDEAERRVVNRMLGDFPDLARSIEAGERPTPADLELFLHALQSARQEGEAS